MTGHAKHVLIPLAFLAFVSLGLPDTLLGVAWPSIRATFGRPLSSLGLLAGFGTAGYFCSSFAAGSMMNRVGVGWILAGSGAIVAVALAGYASSPLWPGLWLAAFLAGVGAGAIDSGINTFAARSFTPRVLNWLHACWGVGATIGPLVMTAALASRFGWRLGYAIVAVAIALLTLVFLATRHLWRLDASPDESPRDRPTILAAIRRPPVAAQTLFFFVYGCVEFGTGNWLFSLLTDARHESVATAGGVVGLYWAALTAGRIAFGQLSHHIGGVRVIRVGLAGAIVGAALLWPGLPRAAALAAPALLGFAIAPLFPTMIALTPARVGDRFSPQSVSFQVAACGLGIAGGSAALGLLARSLGLEIVPAFLFVAVALLVVVHESIDRLARVQPVLQPR